MALAYSKRCAFVNWIKQQVINFSQTIQFCNEAHSKTDVYQQNCRICGEDNQRTIPKNTVHP